VFAPKVRASGPKDCCQMAGDMMRAYRLVIFSCVILVGFPSKAQLRDMPSQTEFDPILENVGKKLKDFASTLSDFRAEAIHEDRDRLDTDLAAIGQAQKAIELAHSGGGEKTGVNMQRLVAILSMVDDMALDAATWKSLAELRLCQQIIQHQNAGRYQEFGVRVAMNSEMLREVGGQLLHPALRAAAVADDATHRAPR
jgi:hypothetical protein